MINRSYGNTVLDVHYFGNSARNRRSVLHVDETYIYPKYPALNAGINSVRIAEAREIRNNGLSVRP